MKITTERIYSKIDGLSLSVLFVYPEQEHCRGIVQIIHGMVERKERYVPLMEHLAKHGFASVIHDLRGHGASVRCADDLGYMYGAGAEGLIADCLQVGEMATRRISGVPLLMMGHSMGSLIARCILQTEAKRYAGVILTGSPSENKGVGGGILLAKAQRKLFGDKHKSKQLEALVFGAYAARYVAEGSRFSWMCSDKEVIKEYDADPLCGFTFTVDGFLALFSLMKNTYKKAAYRCKGNLPPVLFLSGADDQCMGNLNKFAAAAQCMREVGFRSVTSKTYEGFRHEVINEIGKEMVYGDILRFLEEAIVAKHQKPANAPMQ